MTLSARFCPATDSDLAAEREQAGADDQGSERNGQTAGAGGGQSRLRWQRSSPALKSVRQLQDFQGFVYGCAMLPRSHGPG